MTRPDEDLAPDDRRGYLESDERDLEAPTADAAEQSVSAHPSEESPRSRPVRRRFEVGEWDEIEQSIVVDLDDDYDR